MILWADFETYADIDLKVAGTYRYAEEAEGLLLAYAIDDGPIAVWDMTADPFCPEDLHHALAHADECVFWNAQFDAAILAGPKQAHLPQIELSRLRCAMAQALSHALPGSLSEACAVLKVPEDQAKHKEGKKLINLFTKPLPKNRKLRRATRLTHPAEWERFKRYAANDIAAMRECVRRMPRWNWDDACIREWHLDQTINRRGFYVDRELTQAGIRAAESEITRLRERFREITQGVVDRPSQREQFMNYMNERFDLGLVDTTKDTFTQLIKEGGLDPEAKELMELCMAANRTSTAKYAALHPAVQADGRFRGGLQFAGAGRTRRWAGRKFQGQNLPARGLPPPEMVESYIEHLKNGTHDLMFDDLMRYGAAALRGVVIAPPGKKLAVADLSNIEGRKLAWFAQEHWKLKAFRDFDAGTGPDLYKITAASILGGSPYDVSKENRNVFGKVPDLASGYQGGVAGYQTFAHAYGVRMADHWDTIQASIEPHIVEKAWSNLEKWGRPQLETLEIDELEWVASETCKLKWRSRHPATVEFWYALQNAARDAIRNPGMTYSVGPFLKVKCVGFLDQRWLVVRLPSGRFLTYFEPHLIDDTICYWGEASEEGKTSRAWVRCFTHGGKLTGNCLAENTLVVTQSGAKRIVDVSIDDAVWDGVEWVRHRGVIAQGRKEVGQWLGVTITPNHLIHDGNSWTPVTQLDERCSQSALVSGRSSVLSPSFAVTLETEALQTAFALAAPLGESTSGSFGAETICAAGSVPPKPCPLDCEKTQTSCPTTLSDRCGLSVTSRLSKDVMTPGMWPGKTTEGEDCAWPLSGLPTAGFSSLTRQPSRDGMNSDLIWAEKTTIVATNPATSDSSHGESTPTTEEAIGSSNTEDSNGRSVSSGSATVLAGNHSEPSPTTLRSVGHPSGLWAATTEPTEVFDLMDCGPRNRFTILTDAGPVIVHNCCQTSARDVIAQAMQRAEDADYLPVLSVHDEVIAEVDDTPEFNAQGLIDILAYQEPWTEGLPLAAAGFTTMRYHKD